MTSLESFAFTFLKFGVQAPPVPLLPPLDIEILSKHCLMITGLGDQTILGYQCDPNMIVVYCSCDPSLLICCDVIGGRHSAWIIKPASDQVIPMSICLILINAQMY